MSQFSVCIETVYTDLPYEERIGRIAALGYKHVEFWHPEGTWTGSIISDAMPKDASVLAQACRDAGVDVVCFVLNAWDGLYGGCPVDAADRNKFLEQVHRTIEFARAIDCRKAIVMPGVLQPRLTRTQMRSNFERALGEALAIAEKNDFTLLLEPLNLHVDHKGVYLGFVEEAAEIVRLFGHPGLKLLYDIYHAQVMTGNLVADIGRHIDIIAHLHVAGVPGRAEPDACELNYPFIFREANRAGYKGLFGLEYFPRLDSERSLRNQLSLVD